MKSFLKSFILATLGSAMFALAVAFFYDPNKLAAGGITGFAVIISHLFPVIKAGTLVFIMNVPLLILALFRFGKKFVALTVYSTACTSFMMNIFENIYASVGIPRAIYKLIAELGWGRSLVKNGKKKKDIGFVPNN